jgi:hypothetical protein
LSATLASTRFPTCPRAVTRCEQSGTNEIHGAAWEFNRNRSYAGQNAYLTGRPKPPFNHNEFGGNIGGPIKKNKWFFFGSYEDLLERSSLTTSGLSLPTEAMRNGNFAGLATLLDRLAGTPFPNNVIPASRIDSRLGAPVALSAAQSARILQRNAAQLRHIGA